MEPDRWRRITLLYHAARAQPTAERQAFLASECGDDPSLRRDVEALLGVDTGADAALAATGRRRCARPRRGAAASGRLRRSAATAKNCARFFHAMRH